MIPMMLVIALQFLPIEPITNPDLRFIQLEACEE